MVINLPVVFSLFDIDWAYSSARALATKQTPTMQNATNADRKCDTVLVT